MSGSLSYKLHNLLGNISGKKAAAVCPKESAARERHAKSLLHSNGTNTIELNPSCVRVVVFKEDKSSKVPLFDSQVNCEQDAEEKSSRSLCDLRSIESLEQSSSTSSSSGNMPPLNKASGWVGGTSAKNRRAGFINRPPTDLELLGEMMFGSMPMKSIGNSVKVHYIRSTDQLMLTKMFFAQRRTTQQCSLTLTDVPDTCPLPGSATSRQSFVDPSTVVTIPRNLSLNSIRSYFSPDSSQQVRSPSLSVPIMHPSKSISSLSPQTSPRTTSPQSSLRTTSPPSSLTVSGSVNSSRNRRIQRSRATSLENGSELYRRVLKPLEVHPQQSSKKRKYSIGVILSLSELREPDIQHFQSFLFSHFTLIDAHLEKLQLCVVEASTCKGPVFIQTISKAYQEFLKDFLSLYKAPRIESPVWLSLVSRPDRRREVCTQFMEEFGSSIVEMESKERKFFLSSLLTAVLSQHLAWVFTVNRQSTDSRSSKMLRKSLGVLAESHPYNPLWAQLGDLFGAVSTPLKLSRTIVTGKNTANVCRLLYILTYFIRCSEIEPWKSSQENHFTDKRYSAKNTLKIPVPGEGPHERSHEVSNERSHDMSHVKSHDLSSEEVNDLICKLDESEVYESRASSVTVISENDPHSLLTPFESPVNVGRDTPIIKPHPFSFRGLVHQSSSGSGSGDVDSLELTTSRTVLRSPRKSTSVSLSSRCSDQSSSQQLHSSLKRGITSSIVKQPITIATSTKEPNNDTAVTHEEKPLQCNCHYGNPNCCAFLAPCESMGFCPIPDGYLTFSPNRQSMIGKNGSTNMMTSTVSCTCQCETHSYPLQQLAMMHLHSKQHNSSSSVDSGYDRSLTASTTTDSSVVTCFTDSLFDKDHSIPPSATWNSQESQTTSDSAPLRRRRAGAISFRSRKQASDCGYLHSSSKSTDDPNHSHTGVSEIPGYFSPCSDLPSPTKPLLPLRISPLIEAGKNYVDVVRERTTCSVSPASETVQHPQIAGGCHGEVEAPPSQVSACHCRCGSLKVEDGSLKRSVSPLANHAPLFQIDESALPMSSKIQNTTEYYPNTTEHYRNTTEYHRDTNSYHCDTEGESTLIGQINSEKHTSQWQTVQLPSHLPLSSVQQLITSTGNQDDVDRNYSNRMDMLSDDSTRPEQRTSEPLMSDTLSMLSECDSGRGTKSWFTSDQSQPDGETNSLLSHNSEQEELEDDEAFAHVGISGDDRLPLAEDSEGVDVEESLSADTLKKYRQNQYILRDQLNEYDQALTANGRPLTLNQFSDFDAVPLPYVNDFLLDTPSDDFHDDRDQHYQNLSDFGHSLFVGHSSTYLSDFVLHGTSQPTDQVFHDKLVHDLTSTVKHSIIDEPIEHGVAIVADTDTWTVKLVSSSKSFQTNDVIVGQTNIQPSRYIKQLLSTVRSMYEMRLPAEFCLSHVEDRLLELNEQSITLSNCLLEYGSDSDIKEILSRAFDTLGVHDYNDQSLLIVLAGVNCPDLDIRASLNHIHMTRLLGKQYF